MLPDFHDIRHLKVVRSSPSRTGRLYTQECCRQGLSLSQGHGRFGRNMSLKNPATPPGIDPGIIRLVAQRLNHYVTPGPRCWKTFEALRNKRTLEERCVIQNVLIAHFRNQIVPTCLYTHVYTQAPYYVMFNLLPSPNYESLVSLSDCQLYVYSIYSQC